MNKYANITPDGTRDLLFGECALRSSLQEKLSALFESRGYSRVLTPAFEFFDVFNRKSSGFAAENLYMMTDSSGRMLVMRPDSTLPIARVAATRLRDEKTPIRLFYNQRVFKRADPFSGRRNESTQSGIELLGAGGEKADLEVIVTAADALAACGVTDYTLEIGHAGIFQSLAKALDTDEETRAEIREHIETKNLTALNERLAALGDSEAVRALAALPRLFGSTRVLEEAEKIFSGREERHAVKYLGTLAGKLAAIGLGDKIQIDLGLVHRNHYYTGVVFRGFVEGSGLTVVSGGRYDKLAGEFGRPMPSTGFGVEIDSLSEVLLARNSAAAPPPPAVLVFGREGFETFALQRCRELSARGVVCEHCIFNGEDEAHDYARVKHIERLEIISEQGISTVTIKKETMT
ncbi:MAG TPA: ATP phosphoribosyltransferase regulatory subunit [Clostridiales bacterium]|nr:MAG: ATP phosphoribosyltransferase regulatory subunit [Firmicutes bacterium ADurb.Bin262]HQK73534.1 ATP phosphoribosyltransferase regulatory subunit [Clostridiales bacterium]